MDNLSSDEAMLWEQDQWIVTQAVTRVRAPSSSRILVFTWLAIYCKVTENSYAFCVDGVTWRRNINLPKPQAKATNQSIF